MHASRWTSVLLVVLSIATYATLPFPIQELRNGIAKATSDEWKGHPALVHPTGQSGRGGPMVATEIDDIRVLKELSRRFRESKTRNSEDRLNFEIRQEYLLRLLDYLWFDKQRIIGMSRIEVEQIFGHLNGSSVSGGRDCFFLDFDERGRVSGAFYAMGY